MLTDTRTLAINAAFFQEVKDDNLQLRELLDGALKALSGGVGRIRPRALADLLTNLRDQLATHFALEEFFGYFDDAIDAAPRLSAKAAMFRAEHETLYRDICELANQAERLLYGECPPGAPHRLSARFREFYSRLKVHEDCENELILEAFQQDLGVGD